MSVLMILFAMTVRNKTSIQTKSFGWDIPTFIVLKKGCYEMSQPYGFCLGGFLIFAPPLVQHRFSAHRVPDLRMSTSCSIALQ